MRSKKIHTSLLLFAVHCSLFTVLSGCIVITSQGGPLEKDMNSLRQDVALQQQRIANIEGMLKKGTAGLEKEMEPQRKKINALDEAVQRERANVSASLDKMREDMAFLRGRFEEVDVAVKKVNDDVFLLKGKTADKKELDGRLTAVHDQLTALEKKLAAMDERLAALEHAKSSLDEEAKKETDQQEAKAPKPDELYDEAIRFTRDKDYENAIEKFTGFVSLFPNHELAANAQYWIGEIYYAQKDYERAVLEFNEVVKKYPKSKKVPAALLKQGMAFSELGNKKEARLVLEKVMDKYPKTEETGRAKKMLKGLKP